jgi:flagellar biosynthesis protein FliP
MKKTILFLTINIIFLTTNYLLAQTCQAYIPNEWEDNRYTNHGNGTVTAFVANKIINRVCDLCVNCANNLAR